MQLTFIRSLYFLATLSELAIAQANSQLFSQFIGAPTATATFDGPSASISSNYLTICTNYLHGLPDPHRTGLATSVAAQLIQMQVDGVCQFCTSLSQSRVDSCCAAASSVGCFEQFAAQKTPAANSATATGAANTAAATTTKSASGNSADVVGAPRPILFMLSLLGWVLA